MAKKTQTLQPCALPSRSLQPRSLQPRFSQKEMEDIVECYLRHRAQVLINCLDKCKQIYDNKNPNAFKGFIVDPNHQGLIPKHLKKSVTAAIWNALPNLIIIKDFEDLIEAVGKVLLSCGIKHVPSLWTYDIALRIGYSRSAVVSQKNLPQKFVYTYQGAHDGAKIWFSNKQIPHIIAINNFRQIFQVFINHNIPSEYISMHIENMLCHCPKCMNSNFVIAGICKCDKSPTKGNKFE